MVPQAKDKESDSNQQGKIKKKKKEVTDSKPKL